MGLQETWFMLIAVLLTGYAVLDGFDLGVGVWHLFSKGDLERRTLMKSIGPVWDGNEVWLLTGGGAIFAAFPSVYATVFSGFYLALMLVIFGLIFRAVALEFRSHDESIGWRAFWDRAFSIGSMVPALLFGVALGNLMRGLPLDESMNFTGTFFTLLNPYSLLVGLMGFCFLAAHGAFYLVVKTEGELAAKARKWGGLAWRLALGLFIAVLAYTSLGQAHLLTNFKEHGILLIAPVLALMFVLLTGFSNKPGKEIRVFAFSCLSIVFIMVSIAVSIFPNLVRALNDPALSLTVSNSSSSQLTLKTMLILALIGMPFVIGYTIWVYRMFAGKVRIDEEGY